MGRKPSANPAAILSISLPLSTRSKLDRFNPRNRSKFVNQAILRHIASFDQDAAEFDADMAESEVINSLSERRLAAILLNRLQTRGAPAEIRESVLLLLRDEGVDE
jgi:hypothetical protein